MKMHFSPVRKAVLAAMAVSLLGCGGSQDSGGNSGNVVTGIKLSTTVVDGQVAGAVVYVDKNNDGMLQVGYEPFAMTDKEGDLGNQNGKGYCEGATYNSDYCLDGSFATETDYIIRMTGGFDVSHGQPFNGTMSTKVTSNSDGSLPEFYITPLTTLYYTNMDSTQQARFLAEIGVTEDDINSDFLNLSDAVGTQSAVQGKVDLAKTALMLHKVVEAIALSVEREFDKQINLDDGDKPDVAALVYEAILSNWSDATGSTLSAVLQDAATAATSSGVQKIISDAATAAAAAYDTAAIEAEVTGTTNATTVTNTLITTNELHNTVASLAGAVAILFEGIDVAGNYTDETEMTKLLYGAMRASQVVTNLASNEDVTDPTAVNEAITGFANTVTAASMKEASSDVGSIQDEVVTTVNNTADASTLTTGYTVNTDFSTRPTLSIDAATTLGTTLAGYGGTFNSTKTDHRANDYADIYFVGATTGVSDSGDVVACVTYHDSDNPNDVPMFENDRILGTWAYINDYQLNVVMYVAGSSQATTINSKSIDAGTDSTPGTSDDKWIMNVIIGDEDMGEMKLDKVSVDNYFTTHGIISTDEVTCQ